MNITSAIAGDVRYALRTLAREPLLTTITILTIAVGIGGTTAIFSVVDAVLLRPLPYAQPDRVIRIIENIPADESPSHTPMRRAGMNQDEFNWWRTHSKTLSHLAMLESENGTLRTPQGTFLLAGARVSPALFPILGVPPLLGRGLLPSDERPYANVIVISESVWRRYFAADPRVIGRTLTLGQRAYTVVGVMPPAFGKQAFSVPLYVPPTASGGPIRVAPVIGRLRDGVSLGQANAEAKVLGPQFLGVSPTPGEPPRFEILREIDQKVAPVLAALHVLIGAVAVVLLIVCANVANLLLVRGMRRQHEWAIRRSVGATRGRIARQVLTESLVLAMLAGLLGVVLAYGGVHLLKVLGTISLPERFSYGAAILPRMQGISINWLVLAFVSGLSVATGLLFGALPALRLSRFGEMQSSPTQSTATLGKTRMGHALAALQIGLAMTLLVAAGLLLHSFLNLAAVDPGFDPRHVLSFDLVVPQDYTPERKLQLAENVAARLRGQSDVSSVGFTDLPPLERAIAITAFYAPPGQTVEEVVKREQNLPMTRRTQTRLVSPGYLRALGGRLASGRWFRAQDDTRPNVVALVSESYARRYFGAEGPVGSTVDSHRFGRVTIVGVVGNIHLLGLETDPQSIVFLLARQVLAAERKSPRGLNPFEARTFLTFGRGNIAFTVRTAGNPLLIVSYLRTVVEQVDPALAIDNTLPLERVLSGLTTRPRFYAVLISVFGGIAAFIAAIGIYGVLAYVVGRRTREIGIRMALGAERGTVLGLIFRQGAWTSAIGMAGGLAGAIWLTQYLHGMLFGLTSLDASTYAAVSASFAATVLFAAYIPARRATRIDPLAAVRYE